MKPLDKARKKMESWLNGERVQPESFEDQTPEDKAIVGYVKNKLEEVRTASSRVANEGVWLTNIAYLCGYDSISWDNLSRQFRPINYPGSMFVRRNKIHVNKILPTLQNRLARLLKSPPRYDVRPENEDEENKEAARLGKQVLMQLWDDLRVNQKRIPLTMWMQQCGYSLFKVSWDETKGKKKVMPKEDGGYEVVYEGDMRLDVCSPFEIFPDPLAKTWDECQWVIQAKVRPLTYFKDAYENGEMVKEEECWLTSLQYELRINSFNSQYGSSGSTTQAMKNAAIEISYYEKPSNKHPYGRHIITASGIKLKDGILPIDELPFCKFDDVVVGGKFASEAITTHLRPAQDQLNRGKTLRAAWTNRMLAGKYMAARGAGLAAEALNDQSGEVLAYNPVPNAAEPHYLQVPSIPQYAYQEDETIEKDINDMSGINDPSRGQMPSASIPAIGMQLLIEQDDTRIGVVTEQNEFAYADLGRILLKFVSEYYKTPRLLKIAGKNLEYTVKEFVGGDLKNNFDVHVVRSSTVPGSKVLKRQEILNLFDRGFFGDPTQPDVRENVLSMLEYGDEFEVWKRFSYNKNQIQRGLDKIVKEGIKPPFSEFDNHAMWFQEFNDYRVSEKFELLEDEEKKSLIIETMEEHLQALQRMAAPETMEDLDQAPDLTPTTAAQENEQEILNEPDAQPSQVPNEAFDLTEGNF